MQVPVAKPHPQQDHVDMSKISVIRKGEDFEFVFSLGGESIQGWVATINVRKFPGDPSSITRVITAEGNTWPGFLTSAETALLAIGLYRLVGVLVNSTTDEERQPLIRFNVTDSWAT